MSTRWGYHCETCKVSSPHWLNHGAEALQALHNNRGALIAVQQIIAHSPAGAVLSEVCYVAAIHEEPYPLDFLRDHQAHAVCLESEYMKRRPL